jgi:hypothetical protein
MSISAGTLAPAFASGTTTYTASVNNATTGITLTPTRAEANATITVNGTAVASGAASGNIALSVGSNTITTVVTAQDGSTTKTYTVTVTRASNVNTWTGTNGDFNIGSNWSLGTPTANQILVINTGNVTMTANFDVQGSLTLGGSGTLTVNPNVTLTVTGGEMVTGTNSLIFKSTDAGSGLLGNITSGGSVNGTNVTTERYIPAKRAFRFLSTSVTTTFSINANWQENAGTAANLGTHITGINGTSNGFDATTTNNPSLFTYTGGSWQAVTNTNINTLTAGTGYRLMVRGDRTLSLATNTPTPTPTVLRATGTLKTGNHSAEINQTADGFSFVGNPYQAPVNIKDVINASTNMNTGFVYYWDPTSNARGGYITRNLTANTNVPSSSSFNEFVQPGQAVFVQKDNTATTATLTFTEANKAVGNASAGMFRTPASTTHSALRLKLMTTLNNTLTEVDGALLLFDNSYSWNFDSNDAIKLGNLDEQVAIIIDQQQVAIASQSVPNDDDMLAISLANFRQAAYQWHFELDNYTGPAPFLHDTVLGTLTQITTATVIPFTVDNRITGSYENRFQLLFQDTTLSTPSLNNTITAYPNPARGGDDLFITNVSPTAIISVRNLLGQQTAVSTSPHNNGLVVKPRSSLSAGIYVVAISDNNNTTVIKWIIN